MRQYITFAISLLAAVSAFAQNLNPTVQVTNSFEGKVMEVEKQNLAMAVPDSLMQFDWNFNYSVFDNPYKGAYEFNPYLIEMKPDPVPFDGKRLYARIGAGYSLHPEAQIVWTPGIKGRFGLTLYDDFKGYWGQYNEINGFGILTPTHYDLRTIDSYSGSEAMNRFGLTAKYNFKPLVVSLDGKCDWMNANDLNGSNNAFGQSFQLRVKSRDAYDFTYDLAARFSGISNKSVWNLEYGDIYTFLPVEPEHNNKFREDVFGGDLHLKYKLDGSLSVSLDGSYDHVLFDDRAWPVCPGIVVTDGLDIAPSCTYIMGKAVLTAGLKFSDFWKDCILEQESVSVNEDGELEYPYADFKGRRLYPLLHASYEIADDALVVFADLTGGQRFNTYSDYLSANRHLPGSGSEQYSTVLGDVTENTYSASLGFSGRIRQNLQYKLTGGYSKYINAPLEGLYMSLASERMFSFAYAMSDYSMYFAELNASWKSDRLDASGLFRMQKSEIPSESLAVSFPAFVGSADISYNWNRRLFAGVSVEWSTGREWKGLSRPAMSSSTSEPAVCDIPGWVDLGADLEYKATNKFSLWLKGGNLLGDSVMHNLMIAEKGLYVTAGVALNL